MVFLQQLNMWCAIVCDLVIYGITEGALVSIRVTVSQAPLCNYALLYCAVHLPVAVLSSVSGGSHSNRPCHSGINGFDYCIDSEVLNKLLCLRLKGYVRLSYDRNCWAGSCWDPRAAGGGLSLPICGSGIGWCRAWLWVSLPGLVLRHKARYWGVLYRGSRSTRNAWKIPPSPPRRCFPEINTRVITFYPYSTFARIFSAWKLVFLTRNAQTFDVWDCVVAIQAANQIL